MGSFSRSDFQCMSLLTAEAKQLSVKRQRQRAWYDILPPGGSPMSRDARLLSGFTLILVPTIVYGGLTMLNILSEGAYGTPGPPGLSPLQASLYRAGHAHAGILVILSLMLQVALDHAALGASLVRSLRIGAPVAALLVSGGFFGTAHMSAFRFLIYGGAALVALTTLIAGIGLIRSSKEV
jgi:hypothetical protein